VTISSDAAEIAAARRLVLPGVGAFEDGMRGLREHGLLDAIRAHAAADRPLLGICLGMQMLARVSQEFGTHEGLGLIEGRVVPVPATTTAGALQKIPHIGWSAIRPALGAQWEGTPLAGVHPGTAVYLVHSFHVVATRPGDMLAVCDYGGHEVTAAIRSGHVTGCQFHPEKSGEAGLGVLRSFLEQ
jgi:glutamine amidotransferase